ncbi:MAG: UDP-N-acetylmuramoyl-L-alanine--D-glutamate ligase [Chlorobium sp.]|uniref:UDP-N-acetylmuramoyl-L-alanine--D-glutamate ligase n=1 Tax=Chlorobium sp. TaxID=1095 RepID=UPI0025B9B297|nr:UDP-N-acetylmuramoyl-L-alanine--D-glutamate ligase [Chlorobium sp.]MCF8216307.1 UDP-N-acetylmuramoyl-L-alanine--D-glutamate ligase [Chlorobium sp.]MCF8271209.1 UDP-N-acetylmuramoyl-L-alanine--D-glutamate ligase [Chlorobium sp.]MCF8287583.1 UDP-N-acetylmuramoyl-L-alanine--D-glutamate ligase [Chlorobium sp.]MCF8291122.1 UDP-N-acetylmuramoyl-L-alanine--D-glutamate ligase [Chlorobium sp.]MCF8385241.1 UDP-N-acetylmuramoyl-L-alanine--D-glutamate ligase [Chlorobium sp.]
MQVKGKKISVIGAKRSGMAAAALLSARGASVFVSELAQLSGDEKTLLSGLGIDYEEGGHTGRLCDADLVVVSPGIPRESDVVRMVLWKGIPLFSEIEAASWFCRAKMAGITGTDGKTTTATLLHCIAEEDGRTRGYTAVSAGNIGVPFSAVVPSLAPDDLAIIELSSYQLEGCTSFHPVVSVITNITPDHLDRYHGDIREYAKAKYRIYRQQQQTDALCYNVDDPLLREHFCNGAGAYPFRLIPFGIGEDAVRHASGEAFSFDGSFILHWKDGIPYPVVAAEEFLKNSFRGRHNIYNVLAATAAAFSLGIDREALRVTLSGFPGVEHRQEFVRSLDGVDWINDSKATNVNALFQALNAVPGRLVLIAGGRDKGNDYSGLVDVVRSKVAAIVAIGESREKICRAFEGITRTLRAGTLEDAVDLARKTACCGDTVLFSPGCASFDMFANFEERGRLFKHLTLELKL